MSKSSWLWNAPVPASVGMVLACGVAACASSPVPPPADPPAQQAAADTLRIPPLPIPYIPVATDDEPERGLEFRLREGGSGAVEVEPPGAAAAPLSAAATGALLARLPPLPDTTTAGFRFPAASPPPPRTGVIVTAGFPADTAAAEALPVDAPQPLEVVRVVPAGETGLAPHLTITFNQPMVPLTTVAGTAERDIPVRLTPQPPGRWSWLDPRTLRFTPAGRFPMATEYVVEVPAGIRAVNGQTLASPFRTMFATPAPRALGAYPALDPDTARHRMLPRYLPDSRPHSPSAMPLQPVILVLFDQDVTQERVLAAARLTADGRALPLRLATAEEVQADTVVDALTRNAGAERRVAFRPVAPLPRNADVRVVIGTGALSAEGPRGNAIAQELRFRTYGPLEIASHGCGRGDTCPPGTPWTVVFTNPLDSAASPEPQLRIEPELPDRNVAVRDGALVITGQTRPNTTYRVTIAGGVVDRFGQSLAAPRTLTFVVGPAEPMLGLPGAPMIVLDPEGPPRVRLHSQGHSQVAVSVYRVVPEQWPAWIEALRRSREGGAFVPPGERVSQRVLSIDEPDGFSETLVDVGAAFEGGLGHAIVAIEPTGGAPVDARRRREPTIAWVQSTRIGIAAAVNGSEVLGWATSLSTGEPLAGVELRLIPSGGRALTDASGIAVLELSAGGAAALVASRGGDSALLPENEHGYGGGWHARAAPAELRWLLFSDRGLYRPGETARVKGWLRDMPHGRGADLRIPDVDALTWRLRGPRGEDLGTGELRPNALGGFDTALDLPDALNLGYATLEVEPRDVSSQRRQPGHLPLRVQEFRRPDYEVTLDAEPGPHIVGDVANLELRARYYGGGGLAGAQVQWHVRPEPASYAPPGWDRWQFGRTPVWWLRQPGAGSVQTLTGATDADGSHRVRIELIDVDPPFATTLHADAQAQDVTRQVGSGRATLLVHPAALNVGLRVQRSWVARGEPLEVGVVVVDHDGRTRPGQRVQLVREAVSWTWSPMRAPQTAVTDSSVVCDLVSATEPASCTITLDSAGMHRLRADVQDERGRVSRTEVIVWVPGGGPPPRTDPGRFELTPDRSEYQPGDTARVMIDAPFFPAEGLLTMRRDGIEATDRFRVTSATHELRIPITESHVSGVAVHVELVDAQHGTRSATGGTTLTVPPRTRALEVAVLPRDSVVAPGAETLIDVQVTDATGRAAAGAEVALWMVDEAVLAIVGYTPPDPLATFYPPRAGGYVRDHALRGWIVHWPRSQGPGTVAGTVLGHSMGGAVPGATVRLEGTELAATTAFDGTFVLRSVAPGDYVLVIDGGDFGRRVRITVPAEGVDLGNIVITPGGADGAISGELELMSVIVTATAANPVAVAPPPPPPPPAPPPAPGMEQTRAGREKAEEVDVRTDFAALAVFEPSLRTDARGRVQVRARLPASLTRYRVMAVAVSGARHFGTGEAAVTANKPLMARITAPRFLNYGDVFELPVLVQNATAEQLEVDVAARATGLHFAAPAGRRVVLPPGGRAELRFPAAARRPGTATVQVITAAGPHSDAARVDIPVYTPATTEAFATYGVVDSSAPVVIPVSRPRAVIPEFGGAEITVTSTALQSLTDAVLYLHRYPFLGAEQLASRILAVAALRDVLTAFAAEQLPPPDELAAQAQRDIQLLAGLQNGDGGWGFWYVGEASQPFVSVHAAHALQRARAERFDVPQNAIDSALRYLQNIEQHVAAWPLSPRQGLRAYALYVRHRLADRAAAAEALRMAASPPDRAGGDLPIDAVAWLLNILADDAAAAAQTAELRRSLMNRVEETAGGATFAERYTDGEHLVLHSRRRTDAVVLDALIAADPQNDLIAKLATSLLAHRVRGRWASTQENAWVLLALNRYFRAYEAATPSFRSRVWLGERFVGEHAFRGRTTERLHVEVPMPELLRADTSTLLIAREGQGRMYYRAGLRYAPSDLRPDALERGFTVSRVYEAVDDSADVQRTPDDTWRIRAGARVRVRVVMVAPSMRTHVALVDPLPAGLEPLNPELAGTGFTDTPPPPRDPRARPAPPPVRSWWFVHQNLRDDRAEAFATLLPAGLYEYTYLARATTPGRFVVPPPRAEMLYEPETFGRGSGDTVQIVPER